MSSRTLTTIAIAAISAAMVFQLSGCSAGDTSAKTPAQTAETRPVDGGTLSGQILALTCSGCHGGANDAIPDYQDLDRPTLEARLVTYKTETDGTTVMHRLMRGYSDDEIGAVAEYIAGLDGGAP